MLADAESLSLGELVARRRQVVEMIGMETNRLHQRRNPRVQRMLMATLKTLSAQLAELDYDIDDTVRRSPIWWGACANRSRGAATEGSGPSTLRAGE